MSADYPTNADGEIISPTGWWKSAGPGGSGPSLHEGETEQDARENCQHAADAKNLVPADERDLDFHSKCKVCTGKASKHKEHGVKFPNKIRKLAREGKIG